MDFENIMMDKDKNISKTKQKHFHYKITPDHFTTLKTGRKVNKYIVEAVVFKAGKTWGRDKKNYALVGFGQR